MKMLGTTEEPQHRGLLLAVMDRGTMGMRMLTEIDFSNAGEVLGIKVTPETYDLMRTLVAAAGPALEAMEKPKGDPYFEREAINAREAERRLLEGETVVATLGVKCPRCDAEQWVQPDIFRPRLDCGNCGLVTEGKVISTKEAARLPI